MTRQRRASKPTRLSLLNRRLTFVHVVDTTIRVPIFHDQVGTRIVEGVTYRLTRCDRAVVSFDAVLRRDHAELFCRPCKRCYYGVT